MPREYTKRHREALFHEAVEVIGSSNGEHLTAVSYTHLTLPTN